MMGQRVTGRFIVMLSSGLAAGLFAANAQAQDISGDIGLYNKYLDFDVFVLTDEPVVQGALYATVSDECSAMAWGSHGISTREGGELDVGAICYVPAGDGTVILYGLRSFLRGFQDAWTIAAGYSYGGADLTVEQYFWDGNPDGRRFIAGYTHTGIDRVVLRPMLTYETGLGIPRIFAAGLSAEYRLEGDVSLVAMGFVPLVEDDPELRTGQLQLGVKYTF